MTTTSIDDDPRNMVVTISVRHKRLLGDLAARADRPERQYASLLFKRAIERAAADAQRSRVKVA